MGGDVAAKDDSQKKSSDVMDVDTDNKDVASQSKVATDVAMPVETRLDDTIDEVSSSRLHSWLMHCNCMDYYI